MVAVTSNGSSGLFLGLGPMTLLVHRLHRTTDLGPAIIGESLILGVPGSTAPRIIMTPTSQVGSNGMACGTRSIVFFFGILFIVRGVYYVLHVASFPVVFLTNGQIWCAAV